MMRRFHPQNTAAFAWTTPSLVRVVTNQPRAIGIDVNYKF